MLLLADVDEYSFANVAKVELRWNFELTEDTPYLALMGELRGAYC